MSIVDTFKHTAIRRDTDLILMLIKQGIESLCGVVITSKGDDIITIAFTRAHIVKSRIDFEFISEQYSEVFELYGGYPTWLEDLYSPFPSYDKPTEQYNIRYDGFDTRQSLYTWINEELSGRVWTYMGIENDVIPKDAIIDRADSADRADRDGEDDTSWAYMEIENDLTPNADEDAGYDRVARDDMVDMYNELSGRAYSVDRIENLLSLRYISKSTRGS
jgi:hypothetical protein